MARGARAGGSNPADEDSDHESAVALRIKEKLADSIKWNVQHTLKGDNYRPWEINAKAYFRVRRVAMLLHPPEHPNACTDDELQEIGKALLLSTVDEKYYEYITDADTVYDAFEALRLLRHGRIDNHRVNLFWQFQGLVLEPNEKVRDLVARTKKILHQLAETNVTIEEEHAAVAILIAVSKDSKFGHQVQHMLGMGLELTINNVQAALITCEDLTGMNAPAAFAAQPAAVKEEPPAASSADAIAALSKQVQTLSSKLGKQQQNGKKNGPNRNQQQKQQNQQQRKAPYNKPQENKPQQGVTHDHAGNCLNCSARHRGFCYKACTKCGRMGHYANECRAPARFHAGTSSQSGPAGRANMMTLDNQTTFFPTGAALMAGGMHTNDPFPAPFLPPLDPMMTEEPFNQPMHFGRFPASGGRSLRANTRDSKYNWVLDSGASHHMTGVKSYLFDYQPLSSPAVIQAAGQQKLYCVGKGTMRFTSTVAGVTHRRELHNVWHVPDMSISLLSTQALKRTGCQIFSGGKGDLTEYVVDSQNVCFLVCPHPGSDDALNTPDFSVYINDAYLTEEVAAPSAPATDGICTFADAVHASDPESPDLWHQRLGHTNYQYLYQLVRNGLVKGIS
jgi:gag-polypeptide of LTR copia-type/GAG-pre-integrase domain/Zinc knuckle